MYLYGRYDESVMGFWYRPTIRVSRSPETLLIGSLRFVSVVRVRTHTVVSIARARGGTDGMFSGPCGFRVSFWELAAAEPALVRDSSSGVVLCVWS